MKLLRLITGCTVLMALALLSAAAQKPPPPAAAALEAPEPRQIRVEGELIEKDSTIWVVGEFSVLVDSQTQIVEKRGPAELGAWLIVWALSTPSGVLQAQVVVVDRPASSLNAVVEFSDVLTKIRQDNWVVGGKYVRVGPSTTIVGNPSEGSLVSVKAELQEGALLEAIRIETAVRDAGQVINDFEGKIEALEDKLWVVDGRSFKVSSIQTIIEGTAAVGKHAEVRVLVQGDGSLLATKIRVLEKVEVSMGALVEDIASQGSGAEVWEVLVFPDERYAEPLAVTVHVDGDTLVDESRAVARTGRWADLHAEELDNGEFQAERVRLEQVGEVTLVGNMQQAATASGAGGWAQIDGRIVWLPGQIAGRVAAATGGQGKIAIEGLLLGNGIVWAQSFVPIEGQAP